MTDEILDKVVEIFPQLYQEHSYLFSEVYTDWYERRKYFLKQNDILIEKMCESLEEKYHYEVSKEELFCMQKLFLMYPKNAPKKLLSLPWNVIGLILGLCDKEKRKFYTDICYYLNLDSSTLQKYILNDLYEKVSYLILEIQDYDIVNQDDFLKKVMEVYSMVFE